MIRLLLFISIVIALPCICDAIVDFQFKQAHESTGYSRIDRGDMTRLLERELDRKPAKPKHRMSAGEQAMALKALFGREGVN